MSSKEPEAATPAAVGTTLAEAATGHEDVPARRRAVTPMSVAFLLFAVLSAAAGQVILKHGMTLATESATRNGTSLVVRAATSPWVLLGLTVFAISAMAWLTTLSRLPLSVAYPFNALGYLVILTASTLLLNERTNVWTWVGTAFVAGGLLLVVLTKP